MCRIIAVASTRAATCRTTSVVRWARAGMSRPVRAVHGFNADARTPRSRCRMTDAARQAPPTIGNPSLAAHRYRLAGMDARRCRTGFAPARRAHVGTPTPVPVASRATKLVANVRTVHRKSGAASVVALVARCGMSRAKVATFVKIRGAHHRQSSTSLRRRAKSARATCQA